MTIVSHQHRFIFLKTRKTAGTSIEAALAEACGPNDILAISPDATQSTGIPRRNTRIPLSQLGPHSLRGFLARALKNARRLPRAHELEHCPFLPVVTQHMPALPLREIVGEKIWSSYYKFTIERNPYDRLVSLYFWRKRFYDLDCSFEDFARAALKGSKRQQKSLRAEGLSNLPFYMIGDQICVDKVVLFESLDTSLKDALCNIGLQNDVTLPRLKSRIRTDSDYRSWYDQGILALARHYFRVEEEVFGYRF